MEIQPIAYFHSPLTSKFGLPRQSGLVDSLPGRIVFTPDYRRAEAVRGLEGFDYLWIVWGFSENAPTSALTVRPPRLGGNERVGVFASRSPFRPNGLGLSAVRITAIEASGDICVSGADLMDGTPIYDVKPYVAETDAHPTARSGFVDSHQWQRLDVVLPAEAEDLLTQQQADTLRQLLALDPRPHYHRSPSRVYGMPYSGFDIRFKVEQQTLTVLSMVKILHKNAK